MKYARRIGAVCEGGGRYYVAAGYEKKWLRILEDGTLEVAEGLPQPSKEELEEVKANAERLRKVVAPIAPVPVAKSLPKLEGRIFEYRNAENRLMMAVQRFDFDTPEGRDKRCLPWIFDGTNWLQQGWPDDIPTPLFGNHHHRQRVMIHEGEKAVEAAIEACATDSTHPWRDWLVRFGHCTWQGGGGRVGYANWQELGPDVEVFIMPDNDGPGYKSAQRLTRLLTHVRSVYLFHHRGYNAPRTWDMADAPFTESYEDMERGFLLAEPATVTEIGPNGKPREVLRKNFVHKFAFATATQEFVEVRRPTNFMSVTEFNNTYRHLSSVKDLGGMMLSSPDLPRQDRIGYRPDVFISPSGRYELTQPYFIGDDGLRYVNMYRPPLVVEERPPSRWVFRPFLVYMRHLIPDVKERKILLRWAACMLAGHRLRWAPLLISMMQGTGKSTFARMLRTLVGPSNSAQVTSAALQDKFTSWALNKQLVVVPELNEGSGFKLAEHLKTFIDSDEIPIRRMNTDQYDIESHISFICSSNHFSAISIAKEDRRWYLPTVTELPAPHRGDKRKGLVNLAHRYLAVGASPSDNIFFARLWDWFDERGAEWLLWTARRYGKWLVATQWHGRNDRAPETLRKMEVQDRSLPAWEEMLDDLLENVDIVLIEDLRQYMKDQDLKFVPKPMDLLNKLSEYGFFLQYQREVKDKDMRRGRIGVYSLDGRQLKSQVASREALKQTWSHERHRATLFSSLFRRAAGDEAF